MDMAKSKNNKAAGGSKMMSLNKSKVGSIVMCRILIIILVDVIVSSLFDFVKGEANRELTFHMSVLPVLRIAFGVLLAASVVYLVLSIVKKMDTSAHFMTPAMITAVCLYLFVTAVFYNQFRATPFLFYTMTVIVSVLFAVYYLYTVLFYKK